MKQWIGRSRVCGRSWRIRAITGLAVLAFAQACSRDSRTPVYVYSPHGREQLVLLERAFEEKNPGIDVRWLDMGSQEILDRLRFERVNPQADVWFGGPATIFERGAAESLLQPYVPTWGASIDPRGVGAGHLFYSAYRTPAIIAYNDVAVRPEDAPKDWHEVLDPRWKDKILIRDPVASGTMRAIWGFMIQRGIVETGSEDAGFDFLRQLDGSTKMYVLNPSLLLEKLARQEGLVTLWDLQDVLVVRAKGLPVGYTFPRSGTVVIEDAIALVRGARHPEAAKAYIEFIGSPEAQILAAKKMYRLPARLDLPRDQMPDWLVGVERDMKVADVDWRLLSRETKRWMTTWDREVRGTGGRDTTR